MERSRTAQLFWRWPAGSNRSVYNAAIAAQLAEKKAYQDAAVALQAAIVAVNTENNRITGTYRNYTYLYNIT